jgi:hypothetical protein
MRRPHRPLRTRLERRAAAIAGTLPPALRRASRAVGERALYRDDAVRARRGVDWSAADVVDGFDAWAMLAELVTGLLADLTAAGVEVVQLRRAGETWLVVPAESRGRALAALRDAPGAASRWFREGGRRPRRGTTLDPRFAGDALAVSRLLVSASGVEVCGPEVNVGLEFWPTTTGRRPRPDGGRYAPGTRIAPWPHPVTAYLDPDLWAAAQADPERLVPATRAPALLEVTEGVDIVYTWVDDRDPAWRERRASVADGGDPLSADALDPARTRNRDELRYSLRSVAMYASWVRHVWLVTDGQVPAWLDRANPRLTVVPHAEVFRDPGALPTFNSHAIESQLHHIDGLASQYLYLNDDVFIGRPIRPELFFHGNGIPKFNLSPISIDWTDGDGVVRNGASLAALQDRRFLERTLQRTVTHRMQHSPHAHTVPALAAFEERHPEVFAAVAGSRFRSPQDVSIAAELGHYVGFAAGAAVAGRIAFRYIDIGAPQAGEHMESLLLRRNADCFCLNDVGAYSEPIEEPKVQHFLERYYPVPSPFEIAGA